MALAAFARLRGLHLAVAGRRLRDQRVEQLARRAGYPVYRALEGRLICLRRVVQPAQLSNKLERRSADLFIRCRRREVVQGLDVTAHEVSDA